MENITELYNIKFIPLNLQNLEVNIINTIHFFNISKSINNVNNKKIIYHCIISDIINILVESSKHNKNIITIQKQYNFTQLKEFLQDYSDKVDDKIYQCLTKIQKLMRNRLYFIENEENLHTIDNLNIIRSNYENKLDLSKLIKFIDNNDLIKIYQNYIVNRNSQSSSIVL